MDAKGTAHPSVDLRSLAQGGMGVHDWTSDPLAHLKGPSAQDTLAANVQLAQELGLAPGTGLRCTHRCPTRQCQRLLPVGQAAGKPGQSTDQHAAGPNAKRAQELADPTWHVLDCESNSNDGNAHCIRRWGEIQILLI